MIAFTASFGLLIVSSVFRTTLASALPAATPEKRGSEIFSSQFLGDRGHPGVYATQLNDMSLATAGGRSRRPTKFKIWCDENTGPLSMMPWYNDHDGEDGEAKHWTWGYNPPRGTHKELIVKYESEYIDRVTYGVCGPRGNQRICYLFMRKTNKLTNDQGSVTCGDQNAPSNHVTVMRGADEIIGDKVFLAFAGTSTATGIIGIQTQWVDPVYY